MALTKTDQLIAYVDKMPAFPKSVQKIVSLTSDLNASAKEIVRVIECDPVMTVRVLKAINSAAYGLPHKITSVQRAVVHIGLNTIKNIALGVAAMGMLQTKNNANFNIEDFLLHALTTASISRALAERLGLSQSECSDCFVAGLLHDFGKVVFAEFLADEFKAAIEHAKMSGSNLAYSEVEYIGFDHAYTGKILAEKWQLSPILTEVIAHHHDNSGHANALADCVFTANQISKQLGLGDGGNPVIEPISETVFKRFGTDPETLISALGDLASLKAETHAFIRT
ncbi:MAG: HDOD domain-containing protein [Methylococcaceae bacterium]|jgi:HD-like signal output (HDOD) protein